MADYRHKLIIIKADDLHFGLGIAKFRRLFETLRVEGIVSTAGVVSSTCAMASAEDLWYIRSCCESELIEFWNHGYTHEHLSNLSFAAQRDLILLGKSALEEMTCKPADVFGAPFNDLPDSALPILSELDDLKVVYRSSDIPGKFIIDKPAFVPVELVTDIKKQPDFDFFSRNIAKAKKVPVQVIQVHPNRWNEAGFEAFAKIISWLRDHGYQFVTAVDAAEIVKLRSEPEIPVPFGGTTLAVRAVANDELIMTALSQDLEEKVRQKANYDDFFLGQLRRGSLPIAQFFSDLIKPLNTGRGPFRVLDIGAGIGNWSAAICAIAPNIQVTGVDHQEFYHNAIKAAADAAGYGERLQGKQAQMEALNPKRGSIDLILNVNAINYCADWEAAVDVMGSSLRTGGLLYMVVQSCAFYVDRFMSRLLQGNVPGALEAIQSVLFSSLYESGVLHTRERWRMAPKRSLYSLLSHYGIEVAHEPSFYEKARKVAGAPTYLELVGRKFNSGNVQVDWNAQEQAIGAVSRLIADGLPRVALSAIERAPDGLRNAPPLAALRARALLKSGAPEVRTSPALIEAAGDPELSVLLSLDKGEYKRVVPQAAKVKSADGHMWIGAAHSQLGDFTAAASEFEAGLAIDPSHVGCLAGVALCAGHGKDPALLWDRAAQLASRLLALDEATPDRIDRYVADIRQRTKRAA